MGSFPAFLAAWGPVDMGFGSGQGVKCYHSEHLYGEFWHRGFTVSPDTPLTRLPHLVRRERRSLRRRRRRLAPRRSARARPEARPGRAAPFGHRRVLGRMGADQAEDRRGVPLRADPRDAARACRDRAAGFAISFLKHTSSLISSDRTASTCATAQRKPLMWDAARVRPLDTPDRGAAGSLRSTRSRSAPTAKCSPKAHSTARPRSPSSWRT